MDGVGIGEEQPRVVLGYHGTNHQSAKRILTSGFRPSQRGWLGPGVYFYEYDEDQAWFWAKRHHANEPAVVTARLSLPEGGLDLLQKADRALYQRIARAYLEGLSAQQRDHLMAKDGGFGDFVVLETINGGESPQFPWVRAATLLGDRDYGRRDEAGGLDPQQKSITLTGQWTSRVIRNVNIQVIVVDMGCIGPVSVTED